MGPNRSLLIIKLRPCYENGYKKGCNRGLSPSPRPVNPLQGSFLVHPDDDSQKRTSHNQGRYFGAKNQFEAKMNGPNNRANAQNFSDVYSKLKFKDIFEIKRCSKHTASVFFFNCDEISQYVCFLCKNSLNLFKMNIFI